MPADDEMMIGNRIDTLNSEMCERMSGLEKKVDAKLEDILSLLTSS